MSGLQSGNWAEISTVMSVVGNNAVQKALAQLSGSAWLTPVAFSFGWLAYAFTALISVVAGDGRLMPSPDHRAMVINAASGYKRENKSWIVGRLLRAHETPLNDDIGLHITVFKATTTEAGKPQKDYHFATGIVVILLQLAIAAIPARLHNNWRILSVTISGTLLALLTGSLPQWRSEKWGSCRKNTTKKLIVTGGNGTRHVMVILGDGKGLDLEDLGAAESPRMKRRGEEAWMLAGAPATFRMTQFACVLLATVWVLFVVTVAGLKENVWYVVAIGGLGMVQNMVVAGASRAIGTTGIHLEEIETFEQTKVMDALMDVECEYKNVGKSLVGEFFNGSLRPAEEKWWNGDRQEYDDERKAKRPQSLSL